MRQRYHVLLEQLIAAACFKVSPCLQMLQLVINLLLIQFVLSLKFCTLSARVKITAQLHAAMCLSTSSHKAGHTAAGDCRMHMSMLCRIIMAFVAASFSSVYSANVIQS